ncbi:hypothetical protein [Microcystis sp.]|jgi:hypothetical protein|uniref:hypothetical protein n=1 Tax=Microcystis sp. TaxID=1127 RepID=UPI00391B9B63
MENYTIKLPQKSSIPLNATGYHDKSITSQIKALLSRIAGDSGRNCQDKPNFAALVLKNTVQKSDFSGGVWNE